MKTRIGQRRIVGFWAWFLVLLFLIAQEGETQKIYWTDDRGIHRADLDGGNLETPLPVGLSLPSGIAVDASEGKIYWTDFSTSKIQRANLNGANVEDLVTTGLLWPVDIAVDAKRGKIYWADFGTNKIQRANLDGTVIEDLVTMGLQDPHGIAVDVVGRKIYWADGFFSDKIQRANLDGTNVETLVTGGLKEPNGVAIDKVRRKIYWIDGPANKVQRANLDGANVEDFIVGLDNPQFIALDLTPSSNGIVSVEAKGKRPALWGRVRQNALLQNYPNPFNPETWIPFVLHETAQVKIRIYDVAGNLVRTLRLGTKSAGAYRSKVQAAYWDGKNDVGETVGSGIYFYQMRIGNETFIRKSLLLK